MSYVVRYEATTESVVFELVRTGCDGPGNAWAEFWCKCGTNYRDGGAYIEYYDPTGAGWTFDVRFDQHATEKALVRIDGYVENVNQTARLIGWSDSQKDYVQWGSNITWMGTYTPYYTVGFRPNDGNLGSVSQSSITVASGTTYTTSGNKLTIAGTTITATAKTGCVFTGWSSTSGTVTSPMTIQANFAKQYTYTVTYNANGGSNPPAKLTYGPTTDTSHTFTLSGSATREGFNFGGWMASATSGTVITTIQCTSSTPNKTVYAKWNRTTPTVTVTADSGTKGGITYGGSTKTSQTATVDSDSTWSTSGAILYVVTGSTTRTFTAAPKAGYYFLSWTPTGSGIIGTSNRTFTANFRGNEITITYNANDGSGAPSAQKYTYSSGNVTLSSTKPTRTGYDFLGWASSSTATSAEYSAGQTVTQWTSNKTLYAVWQIKRFVMQFAGDRGCTVSKSTSISLPYGTTYQVVTNNRLQFRYNGTIVESCDITLKTGYEFDKWTPSSGTITMVIVFTASTKRKQLPYFFWDLNDGSTDANIIKTGQPVTNLTAAAWNKLNSDIKTLSSYHGITYTFSNVTSGAAISAAAFNSTRTGISNIPGHGTLPIAAVTGNTILASMYQAASASLKSAYNTAVDAWNNS